jgi:nucleoside-diphosphate-sugar epimerase
VPIWRKVDIRDKNLLESVFLNFQPNLVIHLAARTDLRGNSLEDYDTNIVGVRNLVEVIKGQSNIDRVLFTSSMYVCKPGYIPDKFDEYAPHTFYGESKVQTEIIIKESVLNIPWAILRPTSIWGPWFAEPYYDFFQIVLSGLYVHMGHNACKKTYGYVENTVRQIEFILKADYHKITSKVFYLGDWPEYDISEWADEIANEKNRKVITIPFVFFKLGAWFGDFLKIFGVKFPMTSFRLINMTTDNIHNLKPIMGIMPSLAVSRKEGVKRTINWLNSVKK